MPLPSLVVQPAKPLLALPSVASDVLKILLSTSPRPVMRTWLSLVNHSAPLAGKDS